MERTPRSKKIHESVIDISSKPIESHKGMSPPVYTETSPNRTLKNHPKDIDFEDFKSTPVRKSSYARRSANMKLKHNYLENPFKSSDTIDDYRYNIKGDMQVLESIMVCNQIYIF